MTSLVLTAVAALAALASGLPRSSKPITLHPANPHYFDFRGQPTLLLTSAEHYGAVLNTDFAFVPYLDELHARGFNYTRIFTGAYCEDPQSFNIANNTLAPKPERLLCPWARSSTPGYANGGNKFDLRQWDTTYFQRLREFCTEAGKRGIVVEISLFCPFYEDSMWKISPMQAANNVNGVGDVAREEVYTLKHPALTAVQDAMTRKIVETLKEFDNVFYEICNEPYFGGVTLEWQRHISATIAATEAAFPHRHLIAQNIANETAKIADPDPNVSIFNFHYASPPTAVADNYALGKVIAFDETGFKGTHDLPYRTDAWDFVMAGGGLYNHLDYSFTVAHPDGTAPVTDPTPGGGGPSLRASLAIVKAFIQRFDFVKMQPHNEIVKGGVPDGATARVLAEPGHAYAIYVKGGTHADLTLELPAGHYHAEWVNTHTGTTDKTEDVSLQDGKVTLTSPTYVEDIALRIAKR